MLAQKRPGQRGDKQRHGEIQRHRIGQGQRRKGHVIRGVRHKHDQGPRNQRPQLVAKQRTPTHLALHQRKQNRKRHQRANHHHLGQRVSATDLLDDGVLQREHEHPQTKVQNAARCVVVHVRRDQIGLGDGEYRHVLCPCPNTRPNTRPKRIPALGENPPNTYLPRDESPA